MTMMRKQILMALLPILCSCTNISIDKCIQQATAACDGDIVSLYISNDTICFPRTFDLQCAYDVDSIVGNWHNQWNDSVHIGDYEIAINHVKYLYTTDSIPEYFESGDRYVTLQDVDFDGQKEILLSRHPQEAHFQVYKVKNGRPKLMTEEPYDRFDDYWPSGEGGDNTAHYEIRPDSMEIFVAHDIYPDYNHNFNIRSGSKYRLCKDGKFKIEKHYSIYNGYWTHIDLDVSTNHVEVVKEYKLKDMKGRLNVTLTYEGTDGTPVLNKINLNKIKDLSL